MKHQTIILADDPSTRTNLLPLTFTRPVSELRQGILTLRQKWERRFDDALFGYQTVDYLSARFGFGFDPEDQTLYIASDICATDSLAAAVSALSPGENLVEEGTGRWIARRGPEALSESVYAGPVDRISMLYDIFTGNARELLRDFELLTSRRRSAPLSPTCTVIGDPSLLFLEEGASAECATFNTTSGPIYLGANSTVMEGSHIRGGFAALEHSVVNMGAKIYGATTLGPWSKVGGELNNVVIIGYSNKAHDGFLGNAVIGEWCNIGGGSTASNLKNDYTEIKLWNYAQRRFVRTGLQFCGLIMGDHSKAGINTMFNTATVFGVGVNFHGSGYPRNFTASFSEGSTAGMNDLPEQKFLQTARAVMARRGIELTEVDREIFAAVRQIAETYK
ncbi:MAG: hypothetical protein NC336_05845 [Clostridium sp.]|nr:hypothetical protein [Clostridium sp.]